MTDTPKLNLRQKLIQVYNEIDHVEKSGHNEKQKYWFVKAADVLRVIRAAFAKYGIYAQTNYEQIGTYDIKTNSGGNMHTATVRATIVLFDADSSETMVLSGLGDGADGGDKGIYKAQTGATKNALRNGFLLPDEADSDPEGDPDVDRRTSFAPEDMPDFQEARHAAPRPTPAPRVEKPTDTSNSSPKARQEAAIAPAGPSQAAPSTETPASSGATAAVAPSSTETAQAAVPERGDAYEGPEDDGSLPTEAQLVEFRQSFTNLANDLSAKGKLTASAGLKLNRKLLVFLISITKATDAQHITTAQWTNFFERVKAAVDNPEVGLVGLAKLVNKANGIEKKK